jgi:hypothetical protein
MELRPPYMASGLGFPFEVGGPHRGRLQIRKVSFRDYREDPAIFGPTGGAAPRSREKLAPQARQVFRSLDEVVRGLPRLSGLWIRSPDPLAGQLGFWQVGST